mgnify:CR=1 FL=1
MENVQIMPNNVATEAELLGAILNVPNSLIDIIGILKPDDFYKTSHCIIYRAMEDLFKNNVNIDITTIANKLGNKLQEVGGIGYLSKLMGSSLGNNVQEYAKIIKEKSNKRKLIRIARKVTESCYEDKETTTDLVNKTEEELFKVSLNKKNKMQPFNKVLETTVTHIEDACKNKDLNNGVTGIDTGFRDINRMTGGLQKQDLIILAARPSMGKTTLAVNIVTNVSKTKVVAMFSLEMSKEQLTRKVIASTAHIDLLKINTGNLDDKDWTNIGYASGPLAGRKLFIDDAGGLSVAEIKAKCKKIKLQYGLDLVVVDYLQLMTGRGENRTQEISGISRGLKQIGKDLDVTVIALSQLSRAPEARTNHRPMLSDLRESGSIEQDADIVMFLYRDEYYDKDTEDKNLAELIFAKNRNGIAKTVKLAWLGQFQTFGQLDYVHDGGFDPDAFKEDKKKDSEAEEEEQMKITVMEV